jgi:hypothetical protein
VSKTHRHYTVTVDVEQIVPDDCLHRKDRSADIVGRWWYNLLAVDHAEACEQALEQFHYKVPISGLDSFSISTRSWVDF